MKSFSVDSIGKIAASFKSGKIIALPTETVFGLAVSLDSSTASERLMNLKDRSVDSGKVFTLVPESPETIKTYANIPDLAKPLIENYVPGPLTLILPKNPTFKHPYFDHFSSIGLRIPDFPLFRKLLKKSGPLLLTSANLRGQPSYQSPSEIAQNLPIDALVEAPAANQQPSTIVKVTDHLEILRKGDIIIKE